MFNQLAGAFNFRDLGGIQAKSSRQIREGLFFRSASVSELSVAELRAIHALKIGSIIDLRNNRERADHPTPWQQMGCGHYWFHDHEPPGNGDLSALLDDESLTAEFLRGIMLQAYRQFPYAQIEAQRRLLQTLAAGERPVLIHCTSGKDRTGVAVALVLSALEVPRETILADYLATRAFEILSSPAYRRDQPFAPGRLGALRPIYTVDCDYLDAMFEAIERRDGSMEAFFHRTLDLSVPDLEAVRKNLLA